MADQAKNAKHYGNSAIQKPTGSKELPGRSCSHLKEVNPDIKSGNYWIDPNGGRIVDAFRVRCDMTTGETCVSASTSAYDLSSWSVQSGQKWFSTAFGVQQFAYDISESQLSFLQMLSQRGTQTVNVQCRNTVVAYDRKNDTYEKSATLLSDHDRVISHGHPKLSYNIVKDECQHGKGSVGSTVLEVRGNPQRLPIRDIAFSNGQELGLSIGEACFS